MITRRSNLIPSSSLTQRRDRFVIISSCIRLEPTKKAIGEGAGIWRLLDGMVGTSASPAYRQGRLLPRVGPHFIVGSFLK